MRNKLVLLMGSFLIIAGALIWSKIADLGAAVPETFSRAVTVMAPPEPVTVTEAAMVEAVEQKLELTLAELTFTTEVETGTCGETVWRRLAFNDCLTMAVPGKVEIDLLLDGFGLENIETTAETVTLRLPSLVVGDVVIDHAGIKIRDYDDGFFVFTPDPNLQGEGLAKATDDLRLQACRSDLFAERIRGEERVQALLQPLFSVVGDQRTIIVELGELQC